MENKKIKSFTDLKTWQEAHKLVLLIYKLTQSFPSEEKFGLTNQIRRAAISISSNIAEGFSRHSKKEKEQFYYMARGSLTELQNQLLISRDVKYISNDNFMSLAKQSVTVNKLIGSLLKYLNKY